MQERRTSGQQINMIMQELIYCLFLTLFIHFKTTVCVLMYFLTGASVLSMQVK